ncbi:MAG: carboxypeptidase regulatory-like domain-containing protein [Chitinispirillaceae bacterium]|nr:carboxypeptidase regulatory-like domain-containing protein [Chitinispirillaceae bacterium]
MRRVRNLAAIAAVATVWFIPMECADLGGNTSEVGNPGLTGGLIDGRVGKPADSALVRIYPVYNGRSPSARAAPEPSAAIDSARTDNNGRYRFASLDEGIYRIVGELVDAGDTLYMSRSTILFTDSRSWKDLGWDTLRLPGSIKGRIRVTGENVQGVICYIPGTSFAAFTDSTGVFRITSVPEGTYTVSFKSDRFVDSSIHGIQVRSGAETDIGEVALNLDRSKNEHDVWGVFDSNYQAIGRIEARVTGDSIPFDNPRIYELDWRPDVAGYSGFIYVPASGLFWTVEIWVYDTLLHRTGVQRILINRSSGDIETPRFDPLNALPRITLNDTMVSINDTVALSPSIALFDDDSITAMEWKIGDSGTFTKATSKDTLFVAPADSTIINCSFRVTGAYGSSTTKKSLLTVAQDAPVFDLGPDMTSLAGMPVSFVAEARQRFGTVTMYIWDFFQGDTAWTDSAAGLFARRLLLTSSGETVVVCRVRDDDGNVTADTQRVLVVSEISGVLDASMTLRKDGSPYLVSQTLIIPSGIVLTIEPGTTVRVNGGVVISIYGSMKADGLNAQRVEIIENANDTTLMWGMIKLMEGSSLRMQNCDLRNGSIVNDDLSNPAEFVLDQCHLQNMTVRVQTSGGQRITGSISDCRIVQSNISVMCDKWIFSGNSVEHNRDFATIPDLLFHGRDLVLTANRIFNMSLIAEGGGLIDRDTIENSTTTAIIAIKKDGGSWTISNNLVMENAGTGIFIESKVAGPAAGCLISKNRLVRNGFGTNPTVPPFHHAGIVCLDTSCLIDSNTIINNIIGAICCSGNALNFNNMYANNTFDFRMMSNDSGVVDASNNWWGTTDTVKIRNKILENTGFGTVLIDPVATDSILITGTE